MYCTGCPNKHGNSVTNSRSSLVWNSIVISDFKSHNIIMAARVYFTKYNRIQSKHKQTKCEHSRQNYYRLQLSQ